MRLALVVAAVLVGVVCAENRQKRQAQQQQQQYYPAQQSAQAQAQTQQARYAQSQQQQYQPTSQYQQGQQYSQYDYQQQQQQAQPARRPVQSSRQAPARKVASQQSSQEEEEEEEAKPSPLELLLERSTFKCESKKDGYYADTSVECKAFHYCIGGAKNSFMCAEGTVFHQVHLNCVPADQDICGSSEKYYFVNDYLNKELEQRGPNNTILYADRYYPEGFTNGDSFSTTPQQTPAARAPAFAQQYDDEPAPAPRARPVQRAPAQRPAAPAGVTYRQAAAQPAAQPAYRQTQPASNAAPRHWQCSMLIMVSLISQPASQPAQAYDPYAQYRGGQQAGQNPYYRPAASNQQAQYQYEDQSSDERGVKYDDE
ncbi:mediator of RNA polymerase II transcription subunit 15-like [Galendromus occidentalis]|uniref:Mediator of RNA polymerase II transcription subunit 15-like n=1 Tax=Galendromus occidentalis TaxID=34638 RepID=A0AAJ7SE02_9ACAR|nr:mediator of RNA polymerase II transcription subunit 15-like [Galendromus occidentalis]